MCLIFVIKVSWIEQLYMYLIFEHKLFKNHETHENFSPGRFQAMQQQLYNKIVTGPGKTGLIYTKYTCSYYATYLLFCMCYQNLLVLLTLSWISATFQIQYGLQIKSYQLYLKLSKSGQILHVDKTGFPRSGHNFRLTYYIIQLQLIVTIHMCPQLSAIMCLQLQLYC